MNFNLAGLPRRVIYRLKARISESADIVLGKLGYVRQEEFRRPYIVEKSVEGVDFLLHIRDKSSRLWYDLYSTDPVWMEMRFIRDHLIVPGGVVIECGSHHGATAIMLSHWVGPSGKVYAYEPGRKNFSVLVDNIKLNAIRNVVPVEAAVGADETLVDFIEYSEASMGSRVSPSDAPVSSTAYKVKQVTLDSYAPERPTLVKIDTQGYVYQPLLGMKRLIESQRPNLALEIDGLNAINQYGKNFHKLFNLIESDDYDYFVAFEPSEYPKQMDLNDIVSHWQALNALSKDIHLFARNNKRAVS